MNCIRVLVDEDFGLKSVEFNNPRVRKGARGIIINSDGKQIKMNINYQVVELMRVKIQRKHLKEKH